MASSTTEPIVAAASAGDIVLTPAGCLPLKLGLVIPTLCEAENIGGLLDHVIAVLNPLEIHYEILVVDDDSNDGTGDVVMAIASKDPRVRLIVRKGERGLSGAVLDGWRQTDADVLGVMDADLQHPPELLPRLFEAVSEGNDMAIGSRYTPGGELGRWNPWRKLLSAAAVWATSRYFTFAGELGAGMSASQSLARFARSGSLPKRSCVSSSAIAATAVSDRARGFAARDAARWSAIASASAKLSLARPS